MTDQAAASGAVGRAAPAHTFLVRLWRDRASGEWLGQVTHLQTGQRQAFRRLPEMQAFIEAVARGPGDWPAHGPVDPADAAPAGPGEPP